MAEKTWELSGQYMESCNCDYLCPCIYTNPQEAATHEHCYALMVYRIDRGRHGAVSLDGLKFAADTKTRFASVPIIMLTSQQSPQIMLWALRTRVVWSTAM